MNNFSSIFNDYTLLSNEEEWALPLEEDALQSVWWQTDLIECASGSNTSFLSLSPLSPNLRSSDSIPDRFPYERFWNVVQEISDIDKQVFECLVDLFGFSFTDKSRGFEIIRKSFTEEELKRISSLLEWYFLLCMGFPIQPQDEDVSLQKIKDILGINYLVEILACHPFERICEKTSFTLGEVAESVEASFLKREGEKIFESLSFAEKVQETIVLQFLEHLEADQMLCNIDSYFEFNDESFFVQFADCFSTMSMAKKFRWMLFSSVVSYQMSYVGMKQEGLTAKPGIYPASINGEERRLLEFIDSYLGEVRVKLQPSSLPFKDSVMSGMPAWMPNTGSSCFISSTLWPLYLLFDDEIQRVIKSWEKEPFKLSENRGIQKAMKKFSRLYAKLSSGGKDSISLKEINAFRKVIQLTFPTYFVSSYAFAQEDAYEFLLLMMEAFLQLQCCSKTGSGLEVLHEFDRTDQNPLIEPAHYLYSEALKSVYQSNPLPIFDISLNEKTEGLLRLKDLVTESRKTEELERNAYKSCQEHEGPGFYSVQTSHKEQLVVESKENAPEVFIGRLRRFYMDYQSGVQTKRFDSVFPEEVLEFSVKGSEKEEERVAYDLTAITVHSGRSINSGHYYTYLRKEVEGNWLVYKYDDIMGVEKCSGLEQVFNDVLRNGYVFYYKKRQEGK